MMIPDMKLKPLHKPRIGVGEQKIPEKKGSVRILGHNTQKYGFKYSRENMHPHAFNQINT